MKKMTRGQRKRAEKRAQAWETFLEYAAAASIFLIGYLMLIVYAVIKG